MARAVDMFVERSLMTKRRVLKQTETTAAVKNASPLEEPLTRAPAPVRASDGLPSPARNSEIPEPRIGNGEANSAESIDHLPDDALVPVCPLTHTCYVTAKVSRAVYVRDDRRCQFDLPSGGKCLSRKNPQLHHKRNHAWGGEATEANLTVFCKVHNLHQAELDFGGREQAAWRATR